MKTNDKGFIMLAKLFFYFFCITAPFSTMYSMEELTKVTQANSDENSDEHSDIENIEKKEVFTSVHEVKKLIRSQRGNLPARKRAPSSAVAFDTEKWQSVMTNKGGTGALPSNRIKKIASDHDLDVKELKEFVTIETILGEKRFTPRVLAELAKSHYGQKNVPAGYEVKGYEKLYNEDKEQYALLTLLLFKAACEKELNDQNEQKNKLPTDAPIANTHFSILHNKIDEQNIAICRRTVVAIVEF